MVVTLRRRAAVHDRQIGFHLVVHLTVGLGESGCRGTLVSWLSSNCVLSSERREYYSGYSPAMTDAARAPGLACFLCRLLFRRPVYFPGIEPSLAKPWSRIRRPSPLPAVFSKRQHKDKPSM